MSELGLENDQFQIGSHPMKSNAPYPYAHGRYHIDFLDVARHRI